MLLYCTEVGGTWGHGLTPDWSYCRCQLSESSRGPSPSSLQQQWDSRTDWRIREGETAHGLVTHCTNTRTHTCSIWLSMKSGSAVSTSSSKWIMDLKMAYFVLTLWLAFQKTNWFISWLSVWLFSKQVLLKFTDRHVCDFCFCTSLKLQNPRLKMKPVQNWHSANVHLRLAQKVSH